MKRFVILIFMALMISAPSMAYSADWNEGHGNSGRYVGDMLNGKRTGHGTVTYPCGCKYVGELLNNKYNGQGAYKSSAGWRFVGHFINGHRDGKGIFTHSSGETFAGTWHNDVTIGPGIRTMRDGIKWHEVFDIKGNKTEHTRL